MAGPLDWDARSYEQLSTPQQEWGDEVLDRLPLEGDETVLDAGCGAGLVTEKLLGRLPRGRVIGVDASESMVDAARERLGDRVELVHADLHELELPEPVDAVLSTATFHWVPDHPLLWTRLLGLLRPGGRLVAQYGGEGNVAEPARVMRELASREPFAEHLAPFDRTWTFDSAEQAHADLEAAGFADVEAWIEFKQARPPDVRLFLGNSVAPAEMARLPAELRDSYLDALYSELGEPEHLDYVRVNVTARRPACPAPTSRTGGRRCERAGYAGRSTAGRSSPSGRSGAGRSPRGL